MDDGRSSCFFCLYLPSHGTAQWTGRYEPQQGSPNAKYAFGKYPLDRRFWGGRFKVFSETSLWDMWKTWDTPEVSHGFRNFEIAAGDAEGEHWGPPFHDGDMYKWLEACASVYAVTHDQKLDALMDRFIAEVAKAQRADGYIHTPVVIDERHKGIDTHALKDRKDEAEIGITVGGKMRKEPLPAVSTSKPIIWDI